MKKGIKYTLIGVGVVVAGVGFGFAGGKPNGIHMSEGSKYQFESVDPEDIIVEYSGLKPDCSLDKFKGDYLLGVSEYLGSNMSVYLDGELFETKVEEYMPYSDIKWSIVDGEVFWNSLPSMSDCNFESETSMVAGEIVYGDGHVFDVEPESVSGMIYGDGNGCKLNISYGDKVYEVVTSTPWADGEGTGEVESGSQELVPSSSESVVGSSEGVTGERTEYSLEDCPELTRLDWDAFNEAMMTVAFGFVPDLFEWVGEDPRVDWAEVNECFDEYYGGSEGSFEFYCDMINSYLDGGKDEQLGWISILFIEPYHTRNENSEYDELHDKLYNEANADRIAERERILKGYGSYGQMLAVEGIEKYEDDLGALAKYQASLIDTYLSASSDVQLVEGASYFEMNAKDEYEYAIRFIDNYILTAKPFMTDNGEVHYNVKDYVSFFDLVQGYCGDGTDYGSIVGRDIDAVREYAAAQ